MSLCILELVEHFQVVEALHVGHMIPLARPIIVALLRTVAQVLLIVVLVALLINMEHNAMNTCKITLSNLIIQGFEQQEDVEASVQFIVYPEQKGCLSGRWEDAEEWIAESLEICSVKPLGNALFINPTDGIRDTLLYETEIVKYLTDWQIEDIISLVYEEMK